MLALPLALATLTFAPVQTDVCSLLPPVGLDKEAQWCFRWKACKQEGPCLAHEKFAAQIEGLFAHLAKSGKLPAAK